MTNPLWDVCPSLLGDKLQHTSVRLLALLAVDHLHEQGPLHVHLGDLIQRRGREDDLGAKVQLWSLGARGHDERITSVVLVEALHDGLSAAASHVVEMVRVTGVEAAPKACGILEMHCQ